MNLPLVWVIANNRKTGPIPSAYVGATTDETWKSCEGCGLRDNGTCYAWAGLNAMIFGAQITERRALDPAPYTLTAVLKRIKAAVRAARIGVLGDPSRARRRELLTAIRRLRARGLAIVGYTHFWREPANQELRANLMASCDELSQVDSAIALGWRPAVVLPWWHKGKRFMSPGGASGVVCPAQTKDPVTCDSCRMCDPQHPVWKGGKVGAIGFVNHSPAARASQTRASLEKTLPLFGKDT